MIKEWNQIPAFLFFVVRTIVPHVYVYKWLTRHIVWGRKHCAQWAELVVVLKDSAAHGEDAQRRKVGYMSIENRRCVELPVRCLKVDVGRRYASLSIRVLSTHRTCRALIAPWRLS